MPAISQHQGRLQLEERELIRRSQAGDGEAFGELVTKYRARIYSTIFRMVRNEYDACDLVQEGFLKAWRSIHCYEGRSSFYTWLYSLMVNLVMNSLRQKSRRDEVELDEAIPSPIPGPGVNYLRAEFREEVDAALTKLSPAHRAVIVLQVLEDRPYHEIAEILHLSVGTVMSRLFHGRRKLRSILKRVYHQKGV